MAIWSSRSNKVKTKSGVAPKPKVSRYHCVELIIPYDACDAAMKLHGKRFLPADAPSIPLAKCNQRCECRFRHHDDRRHAQRRDPFSVSGIHTMYSNLKNRRLGGDRRRNVSRHVNLG